jgi:DNA polymerase elongation subunit (family B)
MFLKAKRVPIEELVFTKRLSNDSNEYQHRDTLENSALCLLEDEGKYLKAGEILKYVTTDYYNNNTNRKTTNIRALYVFCRIKYRSTKRSLS